MLADTQEDKLDLELFFKFLNPQVVSKEAGERGCNVNNTQTNRSSDKGRDNRRKPSFPRMVSEDGAYTASALLGEAHELTGPSCNFRRAGHESPSCPVFNDKSLDDRWKLVQENKLFQLFKAQQPALFQIFRQPKCFVANCGRRHHKLLHG